MSGRGEGPGVAADGNGGGIAAAAVIVAAGSGSRMRGGGVSGCRAEEKKQYLQLCGLPVLAWALRAFDSVDEIVEIVIVVADGEEAYCRSSAVAAANCAKPVAVVPGGSDRQASVGRGVEAVSMACGIIAVHDGVRPFVGAEEIRESIYAAARAGAACVAVPITDTVKAVSGGAIESTLDRSSLWAAQTPQVFRKELLAEALLAARGQGLSFTDDASLAERMGVRVAVVEGSRENIKITLPSDLALARAIASSRKPAASP